MMGLWFFTQSEFTCTKSKMETEQWMKSIQN